MILCIDAGNSRVKWGWYEGEPGTGGAWSSIANVSLIEFAASSDHINPFSATHENPSRILISNVAGDGAQHGGLLGTQGATAQADNGGAPPALVQHAESSRLSEG
jgi:hypothetical protein